jgi:hypothetical protein
MQPKKTKELVSLKQLILENNGKFPLNFRSLVEQKTIDKENASAVNCSFYKTTHRTVLSHHFPISKPPIF